MRRITVACLSIGMLLQVGCTLMPKQTAEHKTKQNPATSAEAIAARQLEQEGDLEGACTMYEQLLIKQPENPEYLHRLAVVCTRIQRYGEAKNLYERARRGDPKNVTLLSDMGYSAHLRGDSVEAEQLLREALRLQPKDKRATTNLALVVGFQGNVNESLSLLRKVGSEANALVGVAYIHRRRGEYDLAEQRYRAALAIDPNLKDAAQALAELSARSGQQNFVVADTKPVRAGIVHLSKVSTMAVERPVIQQVSAVEEISDRGVMQANFTDEYSTLSTPVRFAESYENDDQSAIGDEIRSTIESNGTSDDQPVMTIPRRRPVATAAAEDDLSYPMQSAAPRQLNSDQLTFGPRRSRPGKSGAAFSPASLLDSETEFPTPISTDDVE